MWRNRLADWITGGALTRAEQCRIESLKTINRMARNREAELRNEVAAWNIREHALRSIAAQEKPTSNATVRRMARMAREALE
jgi:hypothetical protein